MRIERSLERKVFAHVLRKSEGIMIPNKESVVSKFKVLFKAKSNTALMTYGVPVETLY